MIRRVFERSLSGTSPTIEPSKARNRPHDWAEPREPVTQCCRSRHRLVLKGCDVRKPSPPPAMVAGFSYGSRATGPVDAGPHSARPMAAFGIDRLGRCGERTSPRKRDRRVGSAVLQCMHAPRPPHHLAADCDAAPPGGAQDAGAVTPAERVPHASVGMAPTASRPAVRPIETAAFLRAARVRGCLAFSVRPGPSAECPDRSRRSPPQTAPWTASEAHSTGPMRGARDRIGPHGATVASAAGRNAMSTVRKS